MRALSSLLLLALLIVAGCTPEPQPIALGEDGCASCRMTIADGRYAAQIVTTTGKSYKFDSVECMASFYENGPLEAEEVHGLYVSDFHSPEELIPIEEAFFLSSENLRSPMGLNLTAFGPGISRQAVLDSFAGEIMTWNDVRTHVRHEWADEGASGHAHSASMR